MIPRRRFIDIAVNLTDCVFFGVDRKGKTMHASDIDLVVQRALERGVERLIITGTTLAQSKEAIELCRTINAKLFGSGSSKKMCYATVGIHPAHCSDFLEADVVAKFNEANKVSTRTKKKPQAAAGTAAAAAAAAAAVVFSPTASSPASSSSPRTPVDSPAGVAEAAPSPPSLNDEYVKKVLSEMKQLIANNRDCVVALGETGLDYAELSPISTPNLQQATFRLQLEAAMELNIPLILHSRACGADFLSTLTTFFDEKIKERSSKTFPHAVVHSFNGTAAELAALHAMGIDISINGSSFREKEQAALIANHADPRRLMLETDAPWLSPKPTDWGWPVAAAFLDSAVMPPFLAKEKFEMGKCVQNRNEPATLPLVFAQYCAARSELASSNGGESSTRKMFEAEEDDALAEQIYDTTLRVFFPSEWRKAKEATRDDNQRE